MEQERFYRKTGKSSNLNFKTAVYNVLQNDSGLTSKELSRLLSIEYNEDMDKFTKILKKNGIESIDELKRYGIYQSLKILVNIGITKPDELITLKDIIIKGKHYILETIIKAGITKPEELVKLKEIILEGKIDNLETIIGAGITKPEELVELKQIICERRYSDNLKIVIGAGITKPEELVKLKEIILEGKIDNLETIIGAGITKPEELVKLKEIILEGKINNLKTIIEAGITKPEELVKLKEIILKGEIDNLETIIGAGITKPEELVELKEIIYIRYSDNLKIVIGAGITKPEELVKLKEIIIKGSKYNLITIIEAGITKPEELVELKQIICERRYSDNLKIVIGAGITKPEELVKLKEIILEGKIDNLETIIEAGITKPDELVKLQDIIIEGSKYNLITIIGAGITKPYELVKYTKIIKYSNKKDLDILAEIGFILSEKVQKNSKLRSQGFDVKNYNDYYNRTISNNINSLHPDMGLNIKLTEKEADKIINFINNIGGINKGYTILILTVEKMIKDGIKGKEFVDILLKNLDNYQKILDMYPENKIPKGLKISTGLEIEMTEHFGNWYQNTTGKDYESIAYKITKNAKIATGEDGVIEFSTKPSTNPLVTLLEIHLLQELNLLDLNDMQKLGGFFVKDTKFSSRKGTGYHLNMGSDLGITEEGNINFIQNLSTILPRSGISNGDNVNEVNPIDNIRYRDSDYSVYPGNYSKDYVELRTYSIDDVELFEKNVLFNTYAMMGSQAQYKVSDVDPDIILELKDNEYIKNTDDLLNYLENNDLFCREPQDEKSKKIATEFMFMQISILRAIDDYNNNFIDNELFSDEIFSGLSEPRKDLLYDLLFSNQKETLGFEDDGLSSIVVKRHAINLYKSFDINKYTNKEKPFTSDEAKELLKEYGDTVNEKWIPYITKWLNKKVLWEILYINCPDYGEEGWSERLENKIREKISNIDRIKSYIRGNDKYKIIDKEFLLSYFKRNMSLREFDPYNEINTHFVNKIINLNNFFLKEDDTNANGVLDTTVVDGQKFVEQDIPKSSIFETGYMRKGYNYYQGGSENMLLHSAQKIALNYMLNVKNILNTDYNEEPTTKIAA